MSAVLRLLVILVAGGTAVVLVTRRRARTQAAPRPQDTKRSAESPIQPVGAGKAVVDADPLGREQETAGSADKKWHRLDKPSSSVNIYLPDGADPPEGPADSYNAAVPTGYPSHGVRAPAAAVHTADEQLVQDGLDRAAFDAAEENEESCVEELPAIEKPSATMLASSSEEVAEALAQVSSGALTDLAGEVGAEPEEFAGSIHSVSEITGLTSPRPQTHQAVHSEADLTERAADRTIGEELAPQHIDSSVTKSTAPKSQRTDIPAARSSPERGTASHTPEISLERACDKGTAPARWKRCDGSEGHSGRSGLASGLDDPGEYRGRHADAAVAPLPERYALWNRALIEYCLLRGSGGEEVYLAVTPRVLAAALAEQQEIFPTPEEAEADFKAAVSDGYHMRVLKHPARLAALRRYDSDGMPECAAFLALSVLAAFHMRSDEEAAAHAYYVRLTDLLSCKLVGSFPKGFQPKEFEKLWSFVTAWLDRTHGRRLAMPGPDVVNRRFVALPLAHVPLRQVDIEKLPDFFHSASYEPGSRLPRDTIERDLLGWVERRGLLTGAGQAALFDERCPAVTAQVTQELESWDGSLTESSGRRSAAVEIFLDIVQRRPELFYLPRRPAGFPNKLSDCLQLESFDDGWYEPVPIPFEDGSVLLDGLCWEATTTNGSRVAFRRSGREAMALVPSPDGCSGLISHPGLLPHLKCAVLCHESILGAASNYLREICGRPCDSIRENGLPRGWLLFPDVRAEHPAAAVPLGLEMLAVRSSTEILPQGGLRVGRRWTWLAGAPPRILVTGLIAGQQPTIDGCPAAADDDGVLQDEGRLAGSG